MPGFSDYQRQMWTWLSYITVCRFYIDRDKQGNYIIKKSGVIRRFLYNMIWLNSIIKITYLVLTYQGWLPVEVHFLDQMSIWDWFLCFSQVVQETNMWYRKYPLYEVLHANWKIQEDVFHKLGSPSHVSVNIVKTCKSLVNMHCTIVFIGCGALMVQFFTSPKYALNTFAVVPFDNWPLRIIFAAHEYIYIFHIWVHQASSIVLCEVFSSTYTHMLHEMADVMKRLSQQGELKDIDSEENEKPGSHTSVDSDHSSRGWNKKKRYIPDRVLVPSAIAKGTQYDVLTLVYDYKKLMLASKEFNSWAGKLMGGTTMSNYGQFVSDVFMMIQLLKEPDTDIMGVFFFFEDACAGMCMLFRMLIIMSKVYPASEEFLEAYKGYMHQDTPIRKYLRKYEKTLRIIAAKIGGYSTNPRTVPKGINALMNYYIGAAMWQRPVDRRT